MKTCLIYLGDLTHSNAKAETSGFPLNVAYIAAYAKKLFDDRVEVQLFKSPDENFIRFFNVCA